MKIIWIFLLITAQLGTWQNVPSRMPKWMLLPARVNAVLSSCLADWATHAPTHPHTRKQECIHVFWLILWSSNAVCVCVCDSDADATGPQSCVRNACLLACLSNEVIWELMPNEHKDYHLEQKRTISTNSHTTADGCHRTLLFSFVFCVWARATGVCVCVVCSCAILVWLTCCVDTKSYHIFFLDGVCALFLCMPQRRLHSH